MRNLEFLVAGLLEVTLLAVPTTAIAQPTITTQPKRQSVSLVITELAEIEVGLFRLVAEIKKTIKRINALENIYIPLYQATVKHIEESLEEKEREFLFQLKRQKSRQEEVDHGNV